MYDYDMLIELHVSDAELAEMGVTKNQLQDAVLRALDEGVTVEERHFSLSGFNVAAITAIDKPSCEPEDLDNLIAYLQSVRGQVGNVPVKSNPPHSGRALYPVSVGLSRMGKGSGPKSMVSRGGDPVVVVSH